MAVVLVHGNPETPAVWDLVARRLAEAGVGEPVRLSPPGFGAPVPEGFDPTPAAYRGWLIAELGRFGGPVDLVGHDWGGLHVAGVAMWRPDLLRSWASDALGVLDPGYRWHDLARLWQTTHAGEAWVEEQLRQNPEQKVETYVAMGIDPRVAAPMAEGFDAEMGRCILRLYRAAAQPSMAELGEGLPAAVARPGLGILATEDTTVGTDEQRNALIRRAGATPHHLPGAGHWWMTEDDGRPGADALIRFWGSLAADGRGRAG